MLHRSEIEFQEEDHSIRLKREIVIEIPKNELVAKLSSCIGYPGERDEFRLFCERLEQAFSLEFRARRDQLTDLYELFNPLGCSSDRMEVTSEQQVKVDEARFLEQFAGIMDKSNFKALSDYEWNVALSSQYLFHLPTKIDRKKLDDKFFVDTPFLNTSNSDLGRYYVVFRRGIGTDHKTGYFFKAKLDYIFKVCWDLTGKKLWKSLSGPCTVKPKACGELSRTYDSSDKFIAVKRINISNSFKMKNFFKKFEFQEPTYDHTIIVYRNARGSSDNSSRNDLGIYIKHYKGIPMVDMELILPAKKHPRLPLHDLIKLLVFAFICAAGIISALRRQSRAAIVIGIIVAFISYAMKIYVTFGMNVLEYERDINELMAGKLLDGGRGTLLHVLDEAISQEVKETIIAYYVLMKCGGTVNAEDLKTHCNELIASYFENGTSEFEEKDAVAKLERLGIVVRTEKSIKAVPLKEANAIIHSKVIEQVI